MSIEEYKKIKFQRIEDLKEQVKSLSNVLSEYKKYSLLDEPELTESMFNDLDNSLFEAYNYLNNEIFILNNFEDRVIELYNKKF